MRKNLEVMYAGSFKNIYQIFSWSDSNFTFKHILFTPLLIPLSFCPIDYASEEDSNTDKRTNTQFSNYDTAKIQVITQRTWPRLRVPWLCWCIWGKPFKENPVNILRD
jgi:hypothetical protein